MKGDSGRAKVSHKDNVQFYARMRDAAVAERMGLETELSRSILGRAGGVLPAQAGRSQQPFRLRRSARALAGSPGMAMVR